VEQLSNELLLESYHKANELDLSTDFVALIEEEMSKRDLPIPVK